MSIITEPPPSTGGDAEHPEIPEIPDVPVGGNARRDVRDTPLPPSWVSAVAWPQPTDVKRIRPRKITSSRCVAATPFTQFHPSFRHISKELIDAGELGEADAGACICPPGPHPPRGASQTLAAYVPDAAQINVWET